MRLVLVLLAGLAAGALAPAAPAQADPYRWCADYGGFDGGGSSNCYFMTIEQCRAALSGMGGMCRENGFYDGRPVGSEAAHPPVQRKKKRQQD